MQRPRYSPLIQCLILLIGMFSYNSPLRAGENNEKAAFSLVGGGVVNERKGIDKFIGMLATDGLVDGFVRRLSSCTATLIGPNVVVTAKHCANSAKPGWSYFIPTINAEKVSCWADPFRTPKATPQNKLCIPIEGNEAAPVLGYDGMVNGGTNPLTRNDFAVRATDTILAVRLVDTKSRPYWNSITNDVKPQLSEIAPSVKDELYFSGYGHSGYSEFSEIGIQRFGSVKVNEVLETRSTSVNIKFTQNFITAGCLKCVEPVFGDSGGASFDNQVPGRINGVFYLFSKGSKLAYFFNVAELGSSFLRSRINKWSKKKTPVILRLAEKPLPGEFTTLFLKVGERVKMLASAVPEQRVDIDLDKDGSDKFTIDAKVMTEPASAATDLNASITCKFDRSKTEANKGIFNDAVAAKGQLTLEPDGRQTTCTFEIKGITNTEQQPSSAPALSANADGKGFIDVQLDVRYSNNLLAIYSGANDINPQITTSKGVGRLFSTPLLPAGVKYSYYVGLRDAADLRKELARFEVFVQANQTTYLQINDVNGSPQISIRGTYQPQGVCSCVIKEDRQCYLMGGSGFLSHSINDLHDRGNPDDVVRCNKSCNDDIVRSSEIANRFKRECPSVILPFPETTPTAAPKATMLPTPSPTLWCGKVGGEWSNGSCICPNGSNATPGVQCARPNVQSCFRVYGKTAKGGVSCTIESPGSIVYARLDGTETASLCLSACQNHILASNMDICRGGVFPFSPAPVPAAPGESSVSTDHSSGPAQASMSGEASWLETTEEPSFVTTSTLLPTEVKTPAPTSTVAP